MDGENNVEKKSSLSVPLAIVLAGALIAGAVYMKGPSSQAPVAAVNQYAKGAEAKNAKVEPLSESDHILGSPTAEITVFEYSDTECPYCKNFHKVMKQIMNEYGKDGSVAWVYRHMPLKQLHSKAMREAAATECAAEVGGKAKFWDYINTIFERTPSNDGLDPAELPKIAKDIGIDVVAFNNCLDSGKYDKKLEDDVQKGIAAGAEGTPYSVIVTKKGETFPIPGYVPYTEFKSIIDGILKGK
jgi:protein-disulfide isomerase